MTNVPQSADRPDPGLYAAVLDVRSPAEFADDHVPGAVNLPVLDDVERQPPQKFFESLLVEALERFDPDKPVWVEAESNRIGDRYVPAALWERMRQAGGVELRMPPAGRVRHLMAEYRHLIADP